MGKDNGSDEAAQARADEEARQARIRAGTTRINSIFDGGTTGSGALTAGSAYDPTKTYYNADGSVWTPTAAPASTLPTIPTGYTGGRSGGDHGSAAVAGPSTGAGYSGGGGGGREGDHSGGSTVRSPVAQSKTAAQQFADMLGNGGLYSGTTTGTGFNDAYYNQQRDNYTNYAMPQLDQQHDDAGKQLTFALDRGGLLDSSVRGEKLSDLQRLYDTQKQGVADKALSYETGARNSVEDARSNLITTLNATGDAEGAASSALARSQALSAPPAYDPLGQLFTDFTSTLGMQTAQQRAAAASGGSYVSPYSTNLFGNTGRVSVSG